MVSDVDIKPCGSYFDLDEQGYIINPASKDKIQPHWKGAVNETVAALLAHAGESVIDSIYVRGSVAKGESVDSVSDLDVLTLMRLDSIKTNTAWIPDFTIRMKKKFPFLTGIDIDFFPITEDQSGREQHVKLLQSACVYGDDRTKKVRPLKPGKELAIRSVCLFRIMEWTQEWLTHPHNKETVQRACTWIMKSFLRSGFELTMERSKKYTRDLYLCYEGFSEYYPEKRKLMKRALYLAINPTGDQREIQEMMSRVGEWLLVEILGKIGKPNTEFIIDFKE